MTNKIKDNSNEDLEGLEEYLQDLKDTVHYAEREDIEELKRITTFEEFKKLRNVDLEEYLQYLKDTVNEAEDEDIEILKEIVAFEEFKNQRNDDDDK